MDEDNTDLSYSEYNPLTRSISLNKPSNRFSVNLRRHDPLRRSTQERSPLTITHSLPVNTSLPLSLSSTMDEEVKRRSRLLRFSRRNLSKNSLLIAEKAKDITMEGILMPGECVITQVDDARHVNPHKENETYAIPQRIRGTLISTNFRLIFLSSECVCPASLQLSSETYWRNIPDYFSVSKGNIHTIQTLVKGSSEYRQLNKHTKAMRIPEEFRIICKDTTRVRFLMSECPPGQVKQFIHAVLHHTQPCSVTKLFAVDLGRSWDPATIPRGEVKVPSYEEVSDWENEVQELKLINWRVSGVNSKFELSQTLPPYLVCPLMVPDKLLTQTSQFYRLGRLPTLSYSTPNGFLLMRSAYLLPEYTGVTPVSISLLEHNYISSCVQQDSTNSMERTEYLRIDLGQDLPTLAQIQFSYARMMEAVHEEDKWLSSVENTKWLEIVSSCLERAVHTVDLLKTQKQHVLLLEPEGRDLTALVATLVQLICDPQCRTLIGFETLIQREWVAYGHPFCTRLKHTSENLGEDDTNGLCPIFLLLLDCCWQIMQQFPTTFEFNSQFLLMMAQEMYSCASATFLFNSIRHKLESLELLADNNQTTFLYTFWQLRRLVYPTQQTETALNPLYCLRQALMSNSDMYSLIEDCLNTFSIHRSTGGYLGRSISLYSMPLHSSRKGSIMGSRSVSIVNKPIVTTLTDNVLFKQLEDTLEPKFHLTQLQIWKDFFVTSCWDFEACDQSYTCMVEKELQKLVKQIFDLYHNATEVQSIIDSFTPDIRLNLDTFNPPSSETSPSQEPFLDILTDSTSNISSSPSSHLNEMTRSCTISAIPPTAPFIKPNAPQIILDKDMSKLHNNNKNNNREKIYFKIPIVSVSECAEALYILKHDMVDMEITCLDMKITREEYAEV
ncbi:Myotubularin-related protein 10 isoform X1 [Oopsacas minuta]|uniref:Myotubularin-related protein 10 isoform X1 n=1 Tax=Oopsacas minuta TaxID=111878 RepID=A0AAV7JD92_9METZ|nr:Myotubularin-related protein 10 isoform X1 [Oopsacas minuta]